MSVTNGERLVTKQDLADFYNDIRPYMGGLPEVVANKFSKGDLYSTEERMVGQGYDGKPLYQKTVSVSISATGWNTASHGISNFDKCVNAWGMAYRADVNMWFAGCSNSVNIGFYMDGTNVACSVDDTRVTQIYITVQYTKTTDTAISIGDETDYSTTEKIVGTWIDSKPIYQKTVSNISITTTDVNDMDIGLPSDIKVQNYYGKVTLTTDNSLTLPLNMSHPSGLEYSFYYSLKNNYFVARRGASVPAHLVDITVQYTKV